jgi:uncharacterized protein (DUF1015 family)
LVREGKPCFYLYRQTFRELRRGSEKTRMALFGRMKLEPFDKGNVVPHEKTLSKPKEDRRKLLEAVEANFSPIFGLYDDPNQEVGAVLAKLSGRPSFYDALDDEGVRHQVWIVDDRGLTDTLQSVFRRHKIYIADGHHRYQTALDHAVRMRERSRAEAGGELPSDFVLMALVDFNDPGLVLMPTHRMILPLEGFKTENALAALASFFDVQKMTEDEIFRELRKAPSPARRHHASFGLMFQNGDAYFLRLKDFGQAKEKMGVRKSDAWCGLDVVVLNHLILEKLWGVPESQWESVICYTHADAEAVAAVRDGKAAAVFLLQDPDVKVLRDMGELGELLPQKTTYFYPKLASGLVFYQHQSIKEEGDHGDQLSEREKCSQNSAA